MAKLAADLQEEGAKSFDFSYQDLPKAIPPRPGSKISVHKKTRSDTARTTETQAWQALKAHYQEINLLLEVK